MYADIEYMTEEERHEREQNKGFIANSVQKNTVMDINKSKLHKRLFFTLKDKCNFGIQRDSIKKRALEEERLLSQKEGRPFDLMNLKIEGIYSFSTFKNYQQIANRFANWLNEKDPSCTSVRKAKKYAKEYIKERIEEGKSPYTLATEKSFFSKVYGEKLDIETPRRSVNDIQRGRSLSSKSINFNEEKNKDLVDIAIGTGGRRSDIGKLSPDDFIRNKAGICVAVRFQGSKGGRDRVSPVLIEKQKEITEFVNRVYRERGNNGSMPLFETVNDKANIHGYRKLYASKLYENVSTDDNYRRYLEKLYNRRNLAYNEGKYGALKKPYITRDNVFKGDRLSIWVVSQALGHNRLNDTVNHYLK